MAEDERKAELIAELERSRSQITEWRGAVALDLDIRTRARRAFTRHPAIWIGAAILLGLIVARIPFRPGKAAAPPRKGVEPVVEKAGIAGVTLAALKLVFDLVRPALTAWITRRVAERFVPTNDRDSDHG
jgi:hypothetical protein